MKIIRTRRTCICIRDKAKGGGKGTHCHPLNRRYDGLPDIPQAVTQVLEVPGLPG